MILVQRCELCSLCNYIITPRKAQLHIRKQKDKLFEGCTQEQPTSLSWQERQAGCREDCSCFPSLIYKRNWVFRVWGTWQVSHKPHRWLAEGNPPTTFTAHPGLCLLLIHQKARTEVRWLRKGIHPALAWGCAIICSCFTRKTRRKNISLRRPAKKKKKKSHFSTWEQIASQVNCTLTPQSSLVTATCSTSYFIRFANGIDLSTRLFINSHPTTRTEIATANRFSEDK